LEPNEGSDYANIHRYFPHYLQENAWIVMITSFNIYPDVS